MTILKDIGTVLALITFVCLFWFSVFLVGKTAYSRHKARPSIETRLDQLEQRVLRLERKVDLKENASLEDIMLSLQ